MSKNFILQPLIPHIQLHFQNLIYSVIERKSYKIYRTRNLNIPCYLTLKCIIKSTKYPFRTTKRSKPTQNVFLEYVTNISNKKTQLL